MSGSTKKWTVADIPSQAGRRAVVTGANSGIGFWTAVELARKGAHVVMACRDLGRGEAALGRLRAEVPGAEAEVELLDLGSLESVRGFAARELDRGLPLDLLINNAGVVSPKTRKETADGFELQFGTNVLGHFVLTALLWPALLRAAGTEPGAAGAAPRPRVVTVASIAHLKGELHFDDLQWTKNYSVWGTYRQSKLANLMLALELDRRLRASGEPASRVMSVAAHPGLANTNLFLVGEFPPMELKVRQWMGAAIGAFMNTDADGAVPTLYAAASPDAVDGGYYGPQGLAEMRGGDAGPAKIAARALDEKAAQRLWGECERLTELQFL